MNPRGGAAVGIAHGQARAIGLIGGRDRQLVGVSRTNGGERDRAGLGVRVHHVADRRGVIGWCFGGGWSLRGVPRQRYSGKVKLIQNLELRSLFWRFNVGKSRFVVGAVAFVDAARIWADLRGTELAGVNVDGGTFKVGTGGGLRQAVELLGGCLCRAGSASSAVRCLRGRGCRGG